MNPPTPEALERLETERNIWVASVRPDGRPHLAPVWFAWHTEELYICTDPSSVKARNLAHNANLSLALENGSNVVICEGRAAPVVLPWPSEVVAIFKRKYDWDVTTDAKY